VPEPEPPVSGLASLASQLGVEPPRSRRWLLGRGLRQWAITLLGATLATLFFAAAAVLATRPVAGSGSTEHAGREVATQAAAGPDQAAGGAIKAFRGPDWIRQENARPGTDAWLPSADPTTWDRIRGYADHTSVDFGEPFALYVTSPGGSWHAEVYRMGWYGGARGRLLWTSSNQAAVTQPPPVEDPKTGMHEARWSRTLDVQPGEDWPPGQYLIKLVSEDGGSSLVPIVIRDDGSRAPLLVQSSVTTWQAYNDWGGTSLYNGKGGDADLRADVVSFDRPYNGNGSGEFFGREFEFINWAERSGYELSYWTDIDLHQHPERALQHRAVLTLGHDEYYSTAMRHGLEKALDRGVNLAFFGANASFRKIRLEPSPLGADRHQVNYRVAADDPLNKKQPSEVTVSWREAPSSDPESRLIGNTYECNPVQADLVIADPTAWMFAGSGFRKGDKVAKAVGNEYDRVRSGPDTPANVQVLTHSPVTCRGNTSFSDSSWYSAPSGAGVWASGTLWWERFLQPECQPASNAPTALRADNPVCKLQRVTANIIQAMAEGPAGAAHPSQSNLARLGSPKGSARP
jgi:hypothetical protein